MAGRVAKTADSLHLRVNPAFETPWGALRTLSLSCAALSQEVTKARENCHSGAVPYGHNFKPMVLVSVSFQDHVDLTVTIYVCYVNWKLFRDVGHICVGLSKGQLPQNGYVQVWADKYNYFTDA